ncbi:MAG TPA: Crp/Fnr family transcriptional regulator [Blastocatellia bacterium]|nr:Crp/Fnr family transcriptional regulator [Blastocatellia bacterium]HMV84074.1 Crp/Fnr family transcriptional regulator [Blastocatellia bacterium]HMZ16862.1 Crp/Fnr family transcriptional regulator [Blastocatellia bacterium]
MEDGDCYIYFPQTVVISQLSMLNDGSTAEVALIGNEGLVGLNFIFSVYIPERQMCVAKAGSALRMRAKVFKKEFESGGALQHLLLNYMGNYVEQISQRAVCNSQHQIEKRLACWLLMMHDRAGGDVLPLTQEQIACRLGTRRSSVTLAARALQEQHTISYFRGQIHILDRCALELAACECYRTISQASKMMGM